MLVSGRCQTRLDTLMGQKAMVPQGIDEASITAWLSDHVPELVAPVTFTLIAGGRSNLTFLQHHEQWARLSGVRTNDRSVHEHKSTCAACHLFRSCDQLNVGNLAGFETPVRRMQLIEFAHQGKPESPSYDGAEDFMGQTESTDGTVIETR